MTAYVSPIALGIAAASIQVVGYILYLFLAKSANAGSWLVWTFGAAADAFSYFQLTGANIFQLTPVDIAKNALPAICALTCLIVFVVLLFSGRFSWPDAPDWFIVLIDGAVTYALFTHLITATSANLTLQGSTVISFIPILRGQLTRTTARETPLPWLVWTMAYGLMLATVVQTSWAWPEIIYPAINLTLHFLVLLVALLAPRANATESVS